MSECLDFTLCVISLTYTVCMVFTQRSEHQGTPTLTPLTPVFAVLLSGMTQVSIQEQLSQFSSKWNSELTHLIKMT